MDNLRLKQVPITQTGMLIRKPVADVFEAFVNPDVTTKFWFTHSSGRLEADKQVQWDWDMYAISIPVTVKAIESNKRIVIEWPGHHKPTTVEWIFAPQKKPGVNAANEGDRRCKAGAGVRWVGSAYRRTELRKSDRQRESLPQEESCNIQ